MVPAALVVVEATWASVVLGAAVQSHAGHHRDVPFLVLAIPGACAALITAAGARRVPGASRRAALLAVPVVALWLVGAGAYLSLMLHGSFGAVFHPWTLSAGASTACDFALTAVGLAVARGVWAATEEARLKVAAVSVGIGAVVYLVVLYVAAVHTHQAYAREAARTAATLLLVAFPGGIACVALAHEGELERGTARPTTPTSTPSLGWLLAIAAPMALVAGLAFFVVFVVAPLAPEIGHLVLDAARGIGLLLASIARLLAHLLPHAPKARLRPSSPGVGLGRAPARAGKLRVALWLVVLGGVLGALAVVAVAVLLARLWWRRPRRARTRARRTTRPPGEQRDSVFSFRHLLDQIRDALARRLPRDPGVHGDSPHPEVEPAAELATVRRHYRRVLVEAGRAGLARHGSETPLELARRLRAAVDPGQEALAAEAPVDTTTAVDAELDGLDALTDLYDRVRYGAVVETARETTTAGDIAERVVRALAASQASSDAAEASTGAASPGGPVAH